MYELLSICKMIMKKHVACLQALIPLAGIVLLSCNGHKNRQYDNIQFDSICVSQTVPLIENDTASPSCDLQITYVYPAQADTAALNIKKVRESLLLFCFGKENMQPDEKTTVESFRDAYVREYRNGLSELYLEDLKSNKDGETGTRAWYTYYQTIEARPVSAAKGYLAYEVNTHNYRGGAHGMYDTRYLNFRMPDGHLMEIEDVFQPGYEAAVDSMLFKRLLEATHSADREELEDKAYLLDMDMYASRNFRLGEDSIHFFYNVYEIAPYSCGTTELALPYGSIKEWMKTEQ